MEIKSLKKTLMYLILAVSLGLLLTLFPLLTFTSVEVTTRYALMPESESLNAQEGKFIESLGSDAQKHYLVTDFLVLFASFTLAFIAYMICKHKMHAS